MEKEERRWRQMSEKELVILADKPEIASNSVAIDPPYKPEIDPSGPHLRHIVPATRLIEEPGKYRR